MINQLLSLRNNQYYFVFSLDASYRELYEKIRVGGDFNEIERNVEYFLSKKQFGAIRNPYVVLQFIVMDINRDDQHAFFWKWEPYLGPAEKANILLWWPRLIDCNNAHVFWKEPAMGWNKHEVIPYEDLTADGGIRHTSFYPEKPPAEARVCAWPWRKLSIGWDGGVGFCCMHWELHGIMGNLAQGSLQDIFEGDKASNLRLSFWNGQFDEIPVCRSCDKRDWWYDGKFEEELKQFYSV